MQPLHDLLHRIRWDPTFGSGAFAIGYVDRVLKAEQLVPIDRVAFDPENPRMLAVTDQDGTTIRIPLHRVRTVYRDGIVIWQRKVQS
jgi:uncharacterized protein (UPF0248 family)